MAARGARAAGRARSARRRADGLHGRRSGGTGPPLGVRARAAGIGLDRRAQPVDTRWIAGDTDRARKYAAELVALPSDVIVANGVGALGPLQQATRTVPIVFVNVPDPVGGGNIASLARPGGNATGFMQSEYSTSGKWLELLKEIAPRVTRVAVLRVSAIAAGPAQFAAIQAMAPSLGVELRQKWDCRPSAFHPGGGCSHRKVLRRPSSRNSMVLLWRRWLIQSCVSGY